MCSEPGVRPGGTESSWTCGLVAFSLPFGASTELQVSVNSVLAEWKVEPKLALGICSWENATEQHPGAHPGAGLSRLVSLIHKSVEANWELGAVAGVGEPADRPSHFPPFTVGGVRTDTEPRRRVLCLWDLQPLHCLPLTFSRHLAHTQCPRCLSPFRIPVCFLAPVTASWPGPPSPHIRALSCLWSLTLALP